MTNLLASVRSRAEAEIALAGGADIIDLKDPDSGALGAVAPEVITETVDFVAGRRPVSATAGDLPMVPEVLSHAVAEIAATGVDFVKVGLFPDAATGACLEALSVPATRGCRLVGVLFADLAPDFALVEALARQSFFGVMLDTATKDGRGLQDHLSHETLGRFVDRAQSAGLFAGLAGSLKHSDLASLVNLGPDYLGFRGALTGAARGAEIQASAVRSLRSTLSLYLDSRDKSAMAAAGAQRAAASFTVAGPGTSSAKSR